MGTAVDPVARWPIAVLFLALIASAGHAQDRSTCYGTTSDGYLENGWKLPGGGANFSSYSTLGSLIGRTYVHSEVHGVILEVYSELAISHPEKVFVYGETGWKGGGEFGPHKTHRNGLSVDFMVPVVNESGESVPLPTNALNKWGYDIEFDGTGRFEDLRIDVEAMAEHIYRLDQAARKRGIKIGRIIFDPQLQPLLHQSARWPYLRENLRFSEMRSWVQHDEHYHVDFDVPCRPGA